MAHEVGNYIEIRLICTLIPFSDQFRFDVNYKLQKRKKIKQTFALGFSSWSFYMISSISESSNHKLGHIDLSMICNKKKTWATISKIW